MPKMSDTNISVIGIPASFEIIAPGNSLGDDKNWLLEVDASGDLTQSKKKGGSWEETSKEYFN